MTISLDFRFMPLFLNTNFSFHPTEILIWEAEKKTNLIKNFLPSAPHPRFIKCPLVNLYCRKWHLYSWRSKFIVHPFKNRLERKMNSNFFLVFLQISTAQNKKNKNKKNHDIQHFWEGECIVFPSSSILILYQKK